jgi:hypothetical protein
VLKQNPSKTVARSRTRSRTPPHPLRSYGSSRIQKGTFIVSNVRLIASANFAKFATGKENEP